jgi:hypothetical protein
MSFRFRRGFAFGIIAFGLLLLTAPLRAAEFRAGAHLEPISPSKFPSPVNGGMKGAFANSVHDHMHARCVALHDGKTGLILCVVDACMVPREVSELAKEIASKKTGIPRTHMLLSATHTHSAATLTPVFQSDADPEYVATVPQKIAQGMIRAFENL